MPTPKPAPLSRLGRACYRHRWRVVAAWVATLVGLGLFQAGVGTGYNTQFGSFDSEATRGLAILEEGFGDAAAGERGSIVVVAERGVDDPAVRDEVEGYLREVAALGDLAVVSPYSEQGALQVAPTGPNAGKLAYASVLFSGDLPLERLQDLAHAIKEAAPTGGLARYEFGGQIFAEFEPPESEIVGVGFAIVILILAFGSVLAMGLPIGMALAGIGTGAAAIGLLSNLVAMPQFTTTLGIMIGLGVGIDYALFIVTRFREDLRRGLAPEDAVAHAINTAGRAVLFAGVTVVISLMGMVLMGLSFITGLAIGATTAVVPTMVASVTLLPALIAIAGHRIEVTRYRGAVAAGLVALTLAGIGLKFTPLLVGLPLAVVVLVIGSFVPFLRREVPQRRPKPLERQTWYRWSRFVQRRPWPGALAGLALLVVLAIPVFSLRLGFSDEGNYPTSTTTRQAYDLLAEGFGPGFNGPLLLVSEVSPGTPPSALAAVAEAVRTVPGVVFASDPRLNPAGTVAQWVVVPATAPQDEATGALVGRLRSEVLPAAVAGIGLSVAVTGNTALGIDFSEYLAGRLPLFFAAVLALSFLLLMAVFRSLLVPLKAVVVNLLSIGAAYGLVVAIFQWGWLSSLVGIGGGAPIEPFVPMMMFAIVFGLSMDYEVFLLSRMKEEYDRTGDNTNAVANGLAVTARVITAAAAIMVFVFGSFLLESDRIVKLFGVGLATAVLLDATIVRMLLVPATMELLGDRNWWLPRWLDRVLPRVDVEGDHGGLPEPSEHEPGVPVGAAD